MGPGNYVDAYQFTNAAGSSRTRVRRSFHRADVPAHHHADQSSADKLLTSQDHVGGLDHGVGSFNRADQTFRFNQAKGLHASSSQGGKSYPITLQHPFEWDDVSLMAIHDSLARIEREIGVPGLANLLATRLTPTDLQSLLLEVYRLSAKQRSPASILEAYAQNRFTRPSRIPASALATWAELAISLLPPDFTPLELSPVCPLATCSGVAAVDQNWSVPTVRNTEVVSDPTNVLALECALRRRQFLTKDAKSATPVNLAASHRVVRPQFFEGPNLFAHFQLFGMVTGGRDQGDRRFEISALTRHADFYVRLLRAFAGPDLRIRLAFSDFGPEDRSLQLEQQLLAPLRDGLGVECGVDPDRQTGRGYYRDLCMKVYASTADGDEIEIGDGGSVDWTQRLLSNSKERLVISGLGSERICDRLAPKKATQFSSGFST